MTDLNSLMIFAKVVEAKSFSEAARLLKMPTQPSAVALLTLRMNSGYACSNAQPAASG